MSHQQAENYALFASNEKFSALWKLTRVMKAAGWRYKDSGDATSKDTTGNPANDLWGSGGIVQGPTVGAFTIGSPTTTSYGGRSTLTGLAGFTSSAPGHFLTITGATNSANNGTWLITAFISATSIVIENPNAVAETTPGGAAYTELSALLDTYPVAFQGTGAQGAWWCAQGPSTLKVPIGTTTPTGMFIRGENVTQATSGATGELLGVLTDTVTGTGYLVVSPRASGTGTGVRGWSNTAAISGDKSTASISPTATVREFVREIVFWKNNATLGHIYCQVIDSASESAATAQTGRFSILAATAQCTATVAPGGASGSPVVNGFPTAGTYVVTGTGGSGSASSGSVDYMHNATTVSSGFGQLLVANNIEDSAISGDASFGYIIGTPSNASTSFAGIGFQRVDDQEPGDVDPYVWFVPTNDGQYTRPRAVSISSVSSADVFNVQTYFAQANLSAFIGTRRRGWSTGDVFQEFGGGTLGQFAGNGPVLGTNTASIDRVACAFVNVQSRESVWVISTEPSFKQRKGTLRWWFYVQGNNGTDTYDGKTWIQLSSQIGPVVIGPGDGTTVPSNS